MILMKYILLCDFFNIFKIKGHYFKAYILFLLLLLVVLHFLHLNESDVFYAIFGLQIKQNPIFLLTYILTRIIFVFLSFQLFTYDFKNNISNLFLRIKPFYWIISRIFSNILILLLLKIFTYFIINSICFLLYDSWFSIFYIFTYLCCDIIYTLFLQIFFIFIYFLYQYSPTFSILLLFLNVLNIFIFFPKLTFISDYWCIYMLLCLFYIIILILLYKSKYVILFERNSDL